LYFLHGEGDGEVFLSSTENDEHAMLPQNVEIGRKLFNLSQVVTGYSYVLYIH